MREIWSLGINDKVLYDNLRIVGTWSALRPKKLDMKFLIEWYIEKQIKKLQRPKKFDLKSYQ